MKKDFTPDDEMPAEFDFSKSIPNPWFVAMHGPEYVRVIDKDLAAQFPDDEKMNAALRSVAHATAQLSEKPSTVPRMKRSRRRAR